jgi:O-antigen biosynthesis protein
MRGARRLFSIFVRPFTLLQTFLARRRERRAMAAHFGHVLSLAEQAEESALLPRLAAGTSPLLSFVVPVFNAPPAYLGDLLASFRRQAEDCCELILSDDGSTEAQTLHWLNKHDGESRVTVVRNKKNAGIASATNAAIARAQGVFVAFLDHDDALAPFAVSRIAGALAAQPGCQFLYTDEVVADSRLRPLAYFLKPAFDPVLLSGVNYINHLSVYRRERLVALGGLRDGFQGSQDYDLLLRYTKDLPAKEILHLPYPAYIWRRPRKSYSVQFIDTATSNARRALGEHFASDGKPALVDGAISKDLHRVRLDINREDWPRVSVVIPSRDALPLISRVLRELTQETDYPSLEIIVVDNGTRDPRVLALYDEYARERVPFLALVEEAPFNFSRAVNRGIARAKGQLILLLNNDVEILDPDWLKEMVSCFDYPETGIVGAKLLYPDRTIQHMGVIAGLGGLAGHWYIGRDENFPGPMGRFHVRQSLSVVTGACMLISRACAKKIGPFDETIFGIAYNDVDFCLRAINAGFRIVLTPFATLIHRESASRGSDETPQNIERFRRDQSNLRARHATDTFEDRAFNPWYSKGHSEPGPVRLDRLPGPR